MQRGRGLDVRENKCKEIYTEDLGGTYNHDQQILILLKMRQNKDYNKEKYKRGRFFFYLMVNCFGIQTRRSSGFLVWNFLHTQ